MTWVTLLKAIVLSCSISIASAQTAIQARAETKRDDPAIAKALDELPRLRGAAKQTAEKKLEGLVRRYDAMKTPLVQEDPAAKARAIKGNSLYRDPAEGKDANWLQNSMEKFSNWIRKRTKQPNLPDVQPPAAPWLGNAITIFAWSVLGLLILGALYLLIRHVRWKGTLARRAKAVLEDDEPVRTLDEWLALADEHEAAGRYREAVRCLYLACLLKFDEGGVARFDRGQTNWEHLARIEASAKKPDDLNFRSPTQHFDRVWYGHIVRGAEDVREFREVYLQIRDVLSGRKAA